MDSSRHSGRPFHVHRPHINQLPGALLSSSLGPLNGLTEPTRRGFDMRYEPPVLIFVSVLARPHAAQQLGDMVKAEFRERHVEGGTALLFPVGVQFPRQKQSNEDGGSHDPPKRRHAQSQMNSNLKQTLHSGRFLALVKEGRWEYADRVNATGAAIILAVTNDQKFILVEQHRIPVHADHRAAGRYYRLAYEHGWPARVDVAGGIPSIGQRRLNRTS